MPIPSRVASASESNSTRTSHFANLAEFFGKCRAAGWLNYDKPFLSERIAICSNDELRGAEGKPARSLCLSSQSGAALVARRHSTTQSTLRLRAMRAIRRTLASARRSNSRHLMARFRHFPSIRSATSKRWSCRVFTWSKGTRKQKFPTFNSSIRARWKR